MSGPQPRIITPDDYQREAMRTMFERRDRADHLYSAIGLTSEAGEYLDMVKKHVFHGHPFNVANSAVLELGDIQWYIAVEAENIGCSLSYIMALNVAKLRKRYPEGFDPERSQRRAEFEQ